MQTEEQRYHIKNMRLSKGKDATTFIYVSGRKETYQTLKWTYVYVFPQNAIDF